MHPLSRFISTNLVLLFHSVPSQTWFRATLKTVSRMFRFVSLADVDAYLQGSRTFNGGCHVSFDDGDRSFVDIAVPVLKELGIPSSLFVSPRVIQQASNYWFQELDGLLRQGADDHVRSATARALGCDRDALGKFSLFALFKSMSIREINWVLTTVRSTTRLKVTRRYNLTEAELLELRDSSFVSIGAHTQEHPILAVESAHDSRAQILDSVKDLSDLLGQAVWSFAYPNGSSKLDFGVREKLSLRECGVRLAFSADNGFFNRRTDPLAIPRGGFDGVERETRAWVTGKLLLAPFWDPMREFLKRGNEVKQRREIRSLLSGRPLALPTE